MIVSTLSYPIGTGQFIAGELSTHEQVSQLFTNFTWTKEDLSVEQATIKNNWSTPYTDVFFNLTAYLLFTFIFSIIASTIPVPSGIFIPVFKIGAALGRIAGEALHLYFPTGVRYGGHINPIIPGGYAVVGAAAFSGAVTHTVSVGVIAFEMTGQITHIVPVMIAVLIANATAALLQPSMYDSIILIKKLPYLPDLLPSSSAMYSIFVEQFMVRDVKFLWQSISYATLKSILKQNKHLRSLPVVDTPENMILLGSVQRHELIKMIDRQIGREKRLEVAAKWQKEAEEKAREEFEKIQKIMGEKKGSRRSSRFEVVPSPDVSRLRDLANNEMLPPLARKGRDSLNQPSLGSFPRKSILKKTNSFNLRNFSPIVSASPTHTPYSTITAAESRLRSAFDVIFRKSHTLQDVHPPTDPEPEQQSITSRNSQSPSIQHSPIHSLSFSPNVSKKVQLVR